jgi:aryl-alcohol dehydrogenase-like predicted oxidoreductase
MEQRKLGSQGFSVSVEGLGCMGMSAFYGPSDEKDNLATLERALELGIDFFDTAEIYGPFKNEILLSKAFKGRRDKVKIATKVGSEVTEAGERLAVNGRPEYIKKAIDRSLRHLGTDHVDLYYLHRIDPNVPIEDSVGALSELVAAGKVRYIGLSEAAPATIRRAHRTHPVTALQTEYSLFERTPEENDVLKTVRELGIGFVPYSPLGRGLLSGAIKSLDDLAPDDFRRSNPRWMGSNFDQNLKLVDRITEIAKTKEVTPSQVALAWVIAKDTVPIPGTRRIKYLEENVGAASVDLTAADIAALEEIVPVGAVSGERYAPQAMAALNH